MDGSMSTSAKTATQYEPQDGSATVCEAEIHCTDEDRSINQQVNDVVRQWVQAYEKARGPVDIVDEEN